MTVETKIDTSNRKREVLVGIRLDSQSRELLNWALVKVAQPGDHVLALHVCKTPVDALKEKPLLDGYLDTYRGLCDMNKVDLKGQILVGSSIRKTLVRDAKRRGAMILVLGVGKHAAMGSWLSVAKYCAKHLPNSTEILTVHNGKILYRRCSTSNLSGGDPRPSFHMREAAQTPVFSENRSEFGDSEISEIDNHNSSHFGRSSEDGSRDASGSARLIEDGSSPIARRHRAHSRAASHFADSLMEQKPGWPLLRKPSLSTQSTLHARKMSVVQWVLNLPDRSVPDSPQSGSDYSSSKSGSPLGREFSDSPHSWSSSISIWNELSEELGPLPFGTDSSEFTWFSYEVLRNSTSQFSTGNLIGKGAYSRVYKGVFPDGKSVAVKVVKSSKGSWKDFTLEVNIMPSIKHKNITPLLGACIENQELISVYEFMSRGSLEETLHGNIKGKSVLTWETRFKIAIGIAEALDYLHNGCSRPVIHRDVKSSNILLSDEFEPKLSDFGLAIWGSTSSQTYDDVVGTFGYLAPEYFMYGKVSEKIDVYSFGVVLLELLSGRKPIGANSSNDQQSLVMWAKPILETGKLREILDPDLDGNPEEGQLQRLILAATLCLTTAASLRPHMKQILKLLEGKETIEDWMKSSVHQQEEKENLDGNDDEVYTSANTKSHLSMAFLDVDDDFTSCSSLDQNGRPSLEEYLKGRWSRSSSFD
ncbi:hypothetical protein Droror1_Dr00007102 [Drosera rotundifolia]